MITGKKIAIIGSGNMGEALIKGMIASSLTVSGNILASDACEDRLTFLKQAYKINISKTNVATVEKADIIILAVKPQIMSGILDEIKASVNKLKCVISVAAGVTTETIKSKLNKGSRVIRVMPNTPALIQYGAAAVAQSENASEEDIKIAVEIFNSVGVTVVVQEFLMDAVTGLSGSGPAYVFMIIEALADAGVKMGLSRKNSMKLTLNTIIGAAKLTEETGKHPAELKDMVASPGGTTIAGIHALEDGKLRNTLINAVEAATKRSKELSDIK